MLLNVEECLERYGSFYGIAKRVRSGELVKLERGLYSDTDEYVSGERRVAKKHPAAVFTMESAFLFHGLSVPLELEALAADRAQALVDDAGEVAVGLEDGVIDVIQLGSVVEVDGLRRLERGHVPPDVEVEELRRL